MQLVNDFEAGACLESSSLMLLAMIDVALVRVVNICCFSNWPVVVVGDSCW